MLAQTQLANTSVVPVHVASVALPYGVVGLLHNASGSSATAELYLDGFGGQSANDCRVFSGELAAGATQPVEIRGQLNAGATFSAKAGTANAINVFLMEGSPT